MLRRVYLLLQMQGQGSNLEAPVDGQNQESRLAHLASVCVCVCVCVCVFGIICSVSCLLTTGISSKLLCSYTMHSATFN